jgi:hypothetical protein
MTGHSSFSTDKRETNLAKTRPSGGLWRTPWQLTTVRDNLGQFLQGTIIAVQARHEVMRRRREWPQPFFGRGHCTPREMLTHFAIGKEMARFWA